MTTKTEKFEDFISDNANHDLFFTRLADKPEIQYLNIFYENRNFTEKEKTFIINLN